MGIFSQARAEEDLTSDRGSRIHVLTYCIDRPQIMTSPALFWSFTPHPQLMLADPLGCLTNISNPTHPNQKSFLLFSQIFSFPVPPLLPWWEWGLVDCQQSDHLNSGSTEHLLLVCFHPPCIWPTVQLENPNLIPTCVLSSNLAPPTSTQSPPPMPQG